MSKFAICSWYQNVEETDIYICALLVTCIKRTPAQYQILIFPGDKTLSSGLTRFISKVTTKKNSLFIHISIFKIQKSTVKSNVSSHAVPHAVQRCVQEALWFFLTWDDFQGSPSVADHDSPLEMFFPAHILTVEEERFPSRVRSAGGFFLSTSTWQPNMKRRRTEGGPMYPYPKFQFHQSSWWCCFAPVQKGAPIRQRRKNYHEPKIKNWSLWGLGDVFSSAHLDRGRREVSV